MRKSPVIKPLNKESGSLYIFQSSSDLLTRTISGSNFDIKFDKFALLELPPLGNSSFNTMQLAGIGSSPSSTTSSIPVIGGLNTDGNIQLATALQNYCLAFENEILNTQETQEYLTSSERIWWKFLSSIGAIRFRNGINSEINSHYTSNNFIEGDLNNPYNNVVKYVGLTNGVNISNLNNLTSSEIFINVGSNAKKLEKVYFKKRLTDSYKSVSLNDDLITGFDTNNARVYLDGKAWFDHYSTGSWLVNNSNFVSESYEAEFTNPNIQHQTIIRTKSDVATLDWNPKIYDNTISTLSEIPGKEEDFKFNTVLIYYTINVNGEEFTNLYGVYFTGGYDFNSSELKSKTKIVPKLNLGESGNSYNFKIQLRIESHNGQNNLTTIDNGENAVELFNRLLTPLNINNLNINNTLSQIILLNSEINSLKAKYDSLLTLKEDLINLINNQSLNENLSILLTENNNDLDWLKRQFNSLPSNLIFDRGLDVQYLSDGQKIIQSVNGLKTLNVSNLDYNSGNGQNLTTNNSNKIQLLSTGSRIILEIPTGCEELILNLIEPTSSFFIGYTIRIKNKFSNIGNVNIINGNGILKINLIDNTEFIQTLTSFNFSETSKPVELICTSINPLIFEIDSF